MNKIIYWTTLVTAWALLPIAILYVAMRTSAEYVKRTIEGDKP